MLPWALGSYSGLRRYLHAKRAPSPPLTLARRRCASFFRLDSPNLVAMPTRLCPRPPSIQGSTVVTTIVILAVSTTVTIQPAVHLHVSTRPPIHQPGQPHT